jgi:hypothetical protein
METTMGSKKIWAAMIIGLVLGWLSVVGWVRSPSLLPTATAQIPDPGAQRDVMHKDLVELNRKMDELLTLLRSGQLKVTCLDADKRIRTEPNNVPKKQGS